jgi:phosphopantetheinyl transferase
MALDREGITVQTMNPVHGRGPVFYASLRHDTEPRKGAGTNGEEARHRLVSTLWDHLAAMESPLWKHCQSSNGAALPIQVLHGPLGRPHLLLGEYRGPAISFSEGGGRDWAALSGDEADIGIDVAGADEFPGEYPFSRVFHPEELQLALKLAGRDLEKGSALLWSIKEAVVKALGCAFHLVDPLQITVCPSADGAAGGDGGYSFPVCLSGKAKVRFPMDAGRSLWVHSFPQRNIWLSIALFNRSSTGHE